MNRDRMLLGLGAALVVAFLASSFVYRKLQQAQAKVKPSNHIQLVVASTPLQVGQLLTANDLALMDWPEGIQPQGSFTSKDDCVGRAVIVPMVSNMLILDQELAPKGSGGGLPVSIPSGMRAVSVGVDDVVAVAGFVTPGTIVDVLATGTVAEGNGESITRTILEHAKVLAVGQQLSTENGKPQSAPVVTLLVSPEDGEKLTLAASTGKIHLALRNVIDAVDVNPPAVYGYNVFMGSARPVAPVAHAAAPKAAPKAPAPPPPWGVQVIRGDKVENQSFPR